MLALEKQGTHYVYWCKHTHTAADGVAEYIRSDQIKSFVSNMLLNWPSEGHAENVDSQVAISTYVNYGVMCICILLLLQFTCVRQIMKSPQRVFNFLFPIVVFFIVICIRLDKYLVWHHDVVELGSIADDLFCLSNTVVSTQPHYRLRQQPGDKSANQSITNQLTTQVYYVVNLLCKLRKICNIIKIIFMLVHYHAGRSSLVA